MSEEQQTAAEAAEESSSMIRTVIVLGFVVLVPAILSLLLVKMVVLPLIAGDAPPPPPTEEVEAIPAEAMAITFDEAQATVLTDDPDDNAPLLMYKIVITVPDAATGDLIEARKAWFTAMLNKLHRNRTRTELNDAGWQESNLRIAKQEAELLLKKLAPGEDHTVLSVMYLGFTVLDL